MEKIEKERRVDDIQINLNLNYACARHRKFHGKDQPLQQLVNCSGSLMQYRLNHDYGDYSAKTSTPASESLQGTLCKDTR